MDKLEIILTITIGVMLIAFYFVLKVMDRAHKAEVKLLEQEGKFQYLSSNMKYAEIEQDILVLIGEGSTENEKDAVALKWANRISKKVFNSAEPYKSRMSWPQGTGKSSFNQQK